MILMEVIHVNVKMVIMGMVNHVPTRMNVFKTVIIVINRLNVQTQTAVLIVLASLASMEVESYVEVLFLIT